MPGFIGGTSPATTVVIGGTTMSPPGDIVPVRLISFVKGGPGSFTFQVRGGPPPASPDPYKGKSVTVTVNSVLRFSGKVEDRDSTYIEAPGPGWVHTYQCPDLRHYGDFVLHSDANNGADSSTYNTLRDNDPLNWIAARAGRTVGQILTDVLTNTSNANALNGYGIGNYTGLPSSPALPSATTTDLSGLTFIPPGPATFNGGKLFSGIDAFLAQWAPWVLLRIEPGGTIRFHNLLSFTTHTLTLDTDPVHPTPLTSNSSECASRVVVYGQQLAEMFLFSVKQNSRNSSNGLSESPFAHDGLTVAQAKAAWTPSDWRQPGLVVGSVGWDNGTCTCPSTTTVTVTSANANVHWVANYWDQTSTGHLGTIFLEDSANTGITVYAQRSIVSNTALSAGGTSTLTLDRALSVTTYNHYVLTGQIGGASAVWCVYALPSWAAAKVAPQSTYPFAYRQSATASATLTSTAIGTVLWSADGSGNPPYNNVSIPVQVDATTGYVHFPVPTYITAGSKPPDDVQALVPIYVDVNKVASPADVGGVPQYSGLLYTSESVSRTLPVFVPSWRDPGAGSNMQGYADQLQQCVRDPVQEGTVVYEGLYETGLEMGVALEIAGTGYSTPWSSTPIPVVQCELRWNTGADGFDYTTIMQVSSRKAHFPAEAFLKPDRTGVFFDWSGSISVGDWMAAGAGALGNVTQGALEAGFNFGANALQSMSEAAANLPNPVDLAARFGVDLTPGPAVAGGGLAGRSDVLAGGRDVQNPLDTAIPRTELTTPEEAARQNEARRSAAATKPGEVAGILDRARDRSMPAAPATQGDINRVTGENNPVVPPARAPQPSREEAERQNAERKRLADEDYERRKAARQSPVTESDVERLTGGAG